MMNPYKVLDTKQGVEKGEIIQAAARAMRKKAYTAREIAIAQKALMNPISKAAHEFINFIDVKTLQGRLDISQRPEPQIKTDLEYRPVQGEGS
ncbi:unnamed protein product [marine sediment metagenome]|uniref:Uncharacterized protein n=1 Tax=marine sediment metagenome TaxID=412755 RepID=X1J0J5_9ZZZZ